VNLYEKMITFLNLGKYGRLGNQMFQIASTIGIAVKNSHDFSFPVWRCHYNNINCFEYFENNLPIFNGGTQQSITEKEFKYSPINLNKRINYDLFGYFQSEKYFEHCKDLVSYFFNPKKEIYYDLENKYKNILENSCSIHVRRGDYLSNTSVYSINEMEYYKNSISEIQTNKQKELNFLVFSDDLDWCKKNFIGNNFVFVKTENHVKDMILMSMCENNIITNSSFSWWAAWINKNKNKKIIAPKKWFTKNSNLYDGDIIPNNWIKI
jgi:hypothetical protein